MLSLTRRQVSALQSKIMLTFLNTSKYFPHLVQISTDSDKIWYTYRVLNTSEMFLSFASTVLAAECVTFNVVDWNDFCNPPSRPDLCRFGNDSAEAALWRRKLAARQKADSRPSVSFNSSVDHRSRQRKHGLASCDTIWLWDEFTVADNLLFTSIWLRLWRHRGCKECVTLSWFS